MSSQVAMLKNSGVKAIVVAGSPTQTASVAAVNASIGLDVPMLGSSSSFVPQLLGTPAGPALEKNLTVTQSFEPFAGTSAGATAVRAAYLAKHDTEPNGFLTWAYMEAKVYVAIVKQACEKGDLTRQGLQKAAQQISDLSTDGITGNLNFSAPGSPATRQSLIAKVDKKAKGGLTVIQKLSVSKLAEEYKVPSERS